MLKGECNCGAVVFQFNPINHNIYMCHCSICRKGTGHSGVAVLIVKKTEFSWLKGEQLRKTWSHSHHDWQSNFCSNCGSPLPGKNDQDTLYVPAGLITDGAERLKVAHHIWVDSKADWDIISDQGKLHDQAFVG